MRSYVSKHGLEDCLEEMMRSVLEEQPGNPTEFCAAKLLSYSNASISPNLSSQHNSSLDTGELGGLGGEGIRI